MIRPSDATIIIKKEMENGLIIPTVFKDLLEYWVYQTNKSGIINQKGEYVTPESPELEEKRILKCIVVCENDPKHIKKDHPNHIVVSGVIFKDDEKKDLTEYLQTTGRS